jgi:hypothetical protein
VIRALLLSSVLAAALSCIGPAFAEGRSRVVIQADPQSRDSGDVASRITAELDNVGFEVVRITPGGPDEGSFATIVLSISNGRVEAKIRIRNAGGDGTNVDARDIETTGASAAIAIRSVESLRATLFELTRDAEVASAIPEDVLRWARAAETEKVAPIEPNAAEAAKGPAEPPKPAAKERSGLVAAHLEKTEFLIEQEPDKTLKPTEPEGAPYVERVWLGGGLSVLGSFGSLGLSFGPRITFDYDLPYGFDIGASFSGQVPAHMVAASAYQLVLLSEASYTIGKRSWVASPHVNLGAGIHIYETTVELQAAPNTVPGLQRGVAFAVSPGLGVELELAPRARMDLDIAAMFVVPEPVLDCCGNDQGFGGFADGAREPILHATADFIFAP